PPKKPKKAPRPTAAPSTPALHGLGFSLPCVFKEFVAYACPGWMKEDTVRRCPSEASGSDSEAENIQGGGRLEYDFMKKEQPKSHPVCEVAFYADIS
ncbi:MAG: hypothetical protein MJZ77_08440, partial [Bacteroidales bacterium]|nr:hypothetical protein [Bacteroidales bacterium]